MSLLHTNNHILFLSCTLTHPGLIVIEHGLEEFTIDRILDSHHRGCGWQFLVWWAGYAAKHDLWIATSELSEFNKWYQKGSDGPDNW